MQLHSDEPQGIKDALKNVGFSLGQLSHQVIQKASKVGTRTRPKLVTLRRKLKAAYKAFKEDDPKVTKTIDIEKEEK